MINNCELNLNDLKNDADLMNMKDKQVHKSEITELKSEIEKLKFDIENKDADFIQLDNENKKEIKRYNDLCKLTDQDSIHANVSKNLQSDCDHKDQLIKALKNNLEDNKLKIDLFKTKEIKMSEYVVQNRQIVNNFKKKINDLEKENLNLLFKIKYSTSDSLLQDQNDVDNAQKLLASRIRGYQARTRVETMRHDRFKLENDKLKLEEEIKAQKILASRVRGVQARTRVESMKQDRDKANQFNRSKHISPRATGVSDSVDKFEKEKDEFVKKQFELEEQIKAQKILSSRVRGVQARTRVESMKLKLNNKDINEEEAKNILYQNKMDLEKGKGISSILIYLKIL
jgi:hypothetical protein